jgi:hypothetical protein
MKYNIFIQDQFYKLIETPNLIQAIKDVKSDIENGLVSFYDNSKDDNIRIDPVESET